MKKTREITIKMRSSVGEFAEDKDMARELRRNVILPALNAQGNIILDFSGVESTTQSFIHALVSELIRAFGIDVLDRIVFKSCNDTVKKLVSIVIDYMQYEEEPTQP